MSQDTPDDIISVGADGALRLLGSGVSERLSRHSGHFRLLPSPKKVILMRGVAAAGGAPQRIRLAGEIAAPGAMCEVFAMLAQAGWRGELVVSEADSARSLFFDQGNVVGAETTLAQERLGAVMYRYGILSEQERGRIAHQVSRGGRFGSASVELGIVSQEAVYKCLRHQIEDIAFATFAVREGTFCFFDGFDSGRLASLQLVSAQRLLMDGVTRMDEIRYFREKIPSSDYVPLRDKAKGGEPEEEYLATHQFIDGIRSIEELGRLSGKGEFAVTKDVYGMIRSGHVLVRPPLQSGGLVALVNIANEALGMVHTEAEALGKSTDLARSLESFASGAGTYDLLFQGAGPDAAGKLNANIVARNVKRFNAEEPEALVRQMLYEYASFAVFSFGSSLGPEKEQQLSHKLGPLLTQLKPRTPQAVESLRHSLR